MKGIYFSVSTALTLFIYYLCQKEHTTQQKGTKLCQKKKYPNLENEPSQSKVDEPMAAYGVNARLTPYTMEELNARIDEAEDDIVAGRTYTSEQVHDMMEKKYPWLCK